MKKKGPWPKQSYDHRVRRYFSFHKVWSSCLLRECECGCREYVKGSKSRYLFQHHCIGKPAHNKGVPMSQEQKLKVSEAKMGQVPWNIGMKGQYSFSLTKEQVERRIESRKSNGKPWHSEEFRAKNGKAHKGKVISQETRLKMSKANQGRQRTKDTIEKFVKSRRANGKPWHTKKTIQTMKQNFLDPKFCKKWFKAHSVLPNKLELRVQRWLNKMFPNEYKYVGDFQTFIGGKCPDFMNVNGQKKLIEVFGDYWHQDDDPQKRIDHFSEYGFKTLVLWESDINSNPKRAKQAIVGFHNC